MDKNNVAESIVQMKVAFTNAQLPEILPTLESVGYTQDRLQGYLTAVSELETLAQKQRKEYAEQFAKTDEVGKKRTEIDKVYKKHLALARIVFRTDVEARKSLDLSGRRKEALGAWLLQIRNFYAQILSNTSIAEKLANVGITQEVVGQAQNELAQIEVLKEQQKKEMGEAQKATEVRDTAFDELYPQYSELIEFAKILLEDEQLLESMGIVVKRE